MMRALAARGHRVYALEQSDIYWDAGGTRARVVPLTLRADDHDWYTAGEPEERALSDFAAVVMRKDPPFDMEYVYSTYLLEARRARRRAGVQPAARDPRPQREDGDRASSREFIAPTLVTRDAARIGAFIDAARATRSSSRSTAWAGRRCSASAPTIRTATSSSRRSASRARGP